MSKSKCPACQADMDDDAIFCNECGLASPPAAVAEVVVPPPSYPVPSVSPNRFEAQPISDRTCPRCSKPAIGTARFCSGCAHDLSAPFVEAKPMTSRDGTVISRSIVNSVRKRYRDGYRHARFINGFGIVIKSIGYLMAGVGVIGGLFAGSQVSRYSSSGEAAVLAFLAGAGYGLVGLALFWIAGVFIMSGAQKLKASLDGAVNSSPFITDLDRAEIMSLTGQLYTTGDRDDFVSSDSADSGWHEQNVDPSVRDGGFLQRSLGPLKANRAALLCYLMPILLPIVASFAIVFLAGLLGELGLVLGALVAMAGPFVLQVIILKTEPHQRNHFVRFHAFQSILLVGVYFAVSFAAAGILYIRGTIIGGPVPAVLGVIFLLTFIFMAVKGNAAQLFKLPLIGDWAENFALQKTSSQSNVSIR